MRHTKVKKQKHLFPQKMDFQFQIFADREKPPPKLSKKISYYFQQNETSKYLEVSH